MLLKNIKVLEFAGIAPGPFCGKILSDFGAQVVRIDKPNSIQNNWFDVRKKSLFLNLKNKAAIDIVRKMCQSYDVLIDPYRPGVLEKMSLGPKDLMEKNPDLIYARLSGFGQSGPLANAPGHDINYLALSGILSTLGRKDDAPTPPVNLLADFAGGGLLCALGIVLSLYDRLQTGKGQVVDLGMSEGAAYVGSFLYSTKDSYLWENPRGENWLDSGAHFYDTYETKDGQYISVGAIEPQFFSALLKGLGLTEDDVQHLSDFNKNKDILKEKFKEKTRDEWSKIFADLEACVMPVLSLDEAPYHPHNISRKNFRKVGRRWEPCAAPRLTDSNGLINPVLKETQCDLPKVPEPLSTWFQNQDTLDILKELGYSDSEINKLVRDNAIESLQSTFQH